MQPGQGGTYTEADIREEIGADAEDHPVALEFLLVTLAALEAAGTPVLVTTVELPYSGGVAVGGSWPDGRTRLLTVTEVNEAHDDYPRDPVALAQAPAHLDATDTDAQALAAITRALTPIEPQAIVEAIAPASWAQLLIRTPGGDLLTVAVQDRH
ncbi:hypothetical protein GCM10009603_36530 [Nocardiopsis exhalans]